LSNRYSIGRALPRASVRHQGAAHRAGAVL